MKRLLNNSTKIWQGSMKQMFRLYYKYNNRKLTTYQGSTIDSLYSIFGFKYGK